VFDAQFHTAKWQPAGTGAGTIAELVERGQILVLKSQGLGRDLRRLID
jgi:hypothetical protein